MTIIRLAPVLVSAEGLRFLGDIWMIVDNHLSGSGTSVLTGLIVARVCNSVREPSQFCPEATVWSFL